MNSIKTIGIDGNEANIDNKVGVNVYAHQILLGIYNLQLKKKYPIRFIIYLRQNPSTSMPKPTQFWQYKVIPGQKLWIITKLMPNLFISKDKPDIFWSPNHYVPPISPVPLVCSIMDLGYLKFSEQFTKYDFWQLKLWSAYSILVSKYIIAISEFSASDIVRHYRFARNKVHTTLLGYDKRGFNTSMSISDVRRIKDKYSIVSDYVLFLGTLKPSKNISGLLHAWKGVCQLNKKIALVVAGKKGWLYKDIFAEVERLGIKDRVIFTDFVPEEDKPALFKGARVFVIPSYWEGFGLDVLNAFACGVPVIASDQGSLPEIVGDAGLLIDPYKPDLIAQAILKVLSMPKEEYNKLIRKGLDRVKSFSWEKASKETLSILMEQI